MYACTRVRMDVLYGYCVYAHVYTSVCLCIYIFIFMSTQMYVSPHMASANASSSSSSLIRACLQNGMRLEGSRRDEESTSSSTCVEKDNKKKKKKVFRREQEPRFPIHSFLTPTPLLQYSPRQEAKVARTISLCTGMQSSTLAMLLASQFLGPTHLVPPACSVVVMAIMGLSLGSFWGKGNRIREVLGFSRQSAAGLSTHN